MCSYINILSTYINNNLSIISINTSDLQCLDVYLKIVNNPYIELKKKNSLNRKQIKD